MKFSETELKGSYIIEIEPIEDERGFFARSFCAEEFEKRGLDPRITQCNISYNKKKGTLRGMHYQASPCEETKIVSCTKGRIYDVIVDLRKTSPTYCKWIAVELSADNNKMLYVPQGLAHGFQSLEDDSIVFYQMGERYDEKSSGGVRWDDPAFGINWPIPDPVLSRRDKNFAAFVV